MRLLRVLVVMLMLEASVLISMPADGVTLPANCTYNAGTVTCVYTGVGSETAFAVPSAITQLSVTAVGQGGSRGANFSATGGLGGTASATITVTPGEQLYVDVAVGGGSGGPTTGGIQGGGGAGGGESDVRTISNSAAGTLNSRLVVAAGGGGGGGSNGPPNPGVGGDAAQPGADGSCSGSGQPTTVMTNSGGGAGGSAQGGVAGTTGACYTTTTPASPGGFGVGGSGGGVSGGGNMGAGGGGGAGYYGGGGGAASAAGAGGGGGSNYVPAGGTTGVAASGTSPSVTISYTAAAPTITSGSSATFAIGSASSFPITATGTPTPAITESGTLPSGVALVDNGDGTATLTGTPASGTAGTYPLTITASNGVPQDATQTFTLTVPTPTIAVSPATLPAGTVAAAYSQMLTGNGGTSPYTFAVSSGALPAGLTLSSAGALSGTPTAGGTFNFAVTATDSSGGSGPYAGTRTYSLTIASPTISVAPMTVPNAMVGVAYSQSFTASGGTSSYSYAVTSGSLPAGLTLSSGVLSGTPTAGGTFNFTVTATDSSTGTGPYTGNRAYSLVVSPATVTITPLTLPDGAVAASYSQTLAGGGGTSPYSFAVTGGSLPAGLTLDPSTGVISGVPTAGGSFAFTVTATDSSTGSGPYTGSQTYTLTIAAPTISVAPTTLSTVTVAKSSSQTITASGGTGPYSFAVTSGALPAGLSLSSAGDITGTPTAGGTFTFTVKATDSSTGSGPYSASRTYSLIVNPPTISVDPAALPDAAVASAYSQTFAASGGTSGYSFAVTAGQLPAGLSLSSSGDLTGTPTAGGTFTFTVTATDSSTGTGPYAGSRAYSLVVTPPTVVVSPTDLPDGLVATAYSRSITASGGTGPYTFAVTSGSLPAGLSLSSTGLLSGTPTEGGSFTFSVTAVDSSTGTGPYNGTQTYSIRFGAPAISITPSSLPAGTVTVAYSQQLAAAGGTGPYSFAVTNGSLPTGLALSSGGVLTGTPMVCGTFAFTATATDSSTGTGPYQASQSYSLSVACIPETVTFKPDGGTAVPSQTVNYGSTVKEPSVSRAGFTFDGWYTAAIGGQKFDFSTPITSSVILYAQWTGALVTPSTVEQGHQITVTGIGFWPGEQVAAVLHSTQLALGTATADSAGDVSFTTTVPATFALGRYTVVLTGLRSGRVGSAALTVTTAFPGGGGNSSNGGSGSRSSGGSGKPAKGSFNSQSSLSTAQIPNIYDVVGQPERIGAAIALGLVWTLILMLASSTLDKVIASNYDSWLAALRRKFPRLTRFFGRFVGLGHEKTWLAIFGVFAMNAIVLDFVDPTFSINWMSLRLLLSSTGALIVETLIPCLLIIRIARRRYGTAGFLRATPFGLIIGSLGVVASRILGFLPGFLSGSTLTYDEPTYKTGEKIWLARVKMAMVLAIGTASWVASWYIPKQGSALTLFCRDLAVIMTASPFMSTTLDLIPFAVFGGSLLFHKARRTWALYMMIAATGFFLLVVPQPHYWLFVGPRLLWWSIIASIVMLAAALLVGIMQYRRTRGAAQAS